MSDSDRLADDLRRACDEVGLPHSASALVQHHRANAGLSATIDADTAAIRKIKRIRALLNKNSLHGDVPCDALDAILDDR